MNLKELRRIIEAGGALPGASKVPTIGPEKLTKSPKLLIKKTAIAPADASDNQKVDLKPSLSSSASNTKNKQMLM
jgi:hypothetical protein